MLNIAIIGAGQVGSRHLQGLRVLEGDRRFVVIDPSKESLKVAKARFDEVTSGDRNRIAEYGDSIESIRGSIDIAIISTNADVRRNVIEQLVGRVTVRYMILEKVAFQTIEDFEYVCGLLKDKGIKAWVNCPRRMYPFYKWLKERHDPNDKITMEFDFGPSMGGESGLACNAIHGLDIFSFLTEQQCLDVDNSGLNDEIYRGRRPEFLEMSGSINATTQNGDFLRLSYQRNCCRPSSQVIYDSNGYYFVFNTELFYSEKSDDWKVRRKNYSEPLQSNLTGAVVKEILQTGASLLTPINESYLHHKVMLTKLNEHITRATGKEYSKCPIT